MSAIESINEAIEAGGTELVIEDSEITDLPIELWQLEKLTSLEIMNCYNLGTLPARISQLKNLRSFKITRSTFSSFPIEFWQLGNLRSLDIIACPRLETIPAEIELLTNLTSLRITGCKALENLPEEIGRIVNLTSIRILNCEKIKLPSSIYKLPNLTFFEKEGDCKISEKSFPQGVPADIQGLVLRVVNPSDEIIALFYGTELLKEANKFPSPEEFCEYYDQLYDDYCNWDNAGVNLNGQASKKQEKDFRKVLQNLRWNTYTLMRIKAKGFNFIPLMLCRLAYPYHCEVNKIEKTIYGLKGNITNYFGDIHILRKANEFGCIEQKYLMQEIIKTGWIYDHPEYWLTIKNIDSYVDYATRNNNSALVAFLLDYQNESFPAKSADAQELPHNN